MHLLLWRWLVFISNLWLFADSPLEEKLASVCRQVGVLHANYGRPWQPARNQSNHLSTTFTCKLPATACQLVGWQVSTVDDLIHLCPADFYYSSFLFITFHFIKFKSDTQRMMRSDFTKTSFRNDFSAERTDQFSGDTSEGLVSPGFGAGTSFSRLSGSL